MADAFRDDPSGRSASRDPASTICDNNDEAPGDVMDRDAVLGQLGAPEAVRAGGYGEGQHERHLATVVGQEPTKPRAIYFPNTREPQPESR